jgi:hypothetical protein
VSWLLNAARCSITARRVMSLWFTWGPVWCKDDVRVPGKGFAAFVSTRSLVRRVYFWERNFGGWLPGEHPARRLPDRWVGEPSRNDETLMDARVCGPQVPAATARRPPNCDPTAAVSWARVHRIGASLLPNAVI